MTSSQVKYLNLWMGTTGAKINVKYCGRIAINVKITNMLRCGILENLKLEITCMMIDILEPLSCQKQEMYGAVNIEIISHTGTSSGVLINKCINV